MIPKKNSKAAIMFLLIESSCANIFLTNILKCKQIIDEIKNACKNYFIRVCHCIFINVTFRLVALSSTRSIFLFLKLRSIYYLYPPSSHLDMNLLKKRPFYHKFSTSLHLIDLALLLLLNALSFSTSRPKN